MPAIPREMAERGGGGDDATPEDEPRKARRSRPHYPHKVKIVDLELNPVTRVHPRCVFKIDPEGRPPCGWRIDRSTRCRKRLSKGCNFQLNADGMCPGWKMRKQPRKKPVEEKVN